MSKYKDMYSSAPILTGRLGVGGEFRAILRDCMGGVDYDSGWFSNLITNTGLINLGTQNWHGNCHIGTNNTAAAFTDTALLGWLAKHNALIGVTNGPVPTAPDYQYYETRGYRFNAGVGTGTIQEVGLTHNTGNSALSIRAVISPGIDKGLTQILDIYYRFTIWPNLTDVTGVVSIEGADYDYIIRPSSVNNGVGSTFMQLGFNIDGSFCHAYQDDIAAITSTPSITSGGSDANADTYGATVVASGSGYKDNDVHFSVDEANSAGIRSFVYRYGSSLTTRGFQAQFNRQSDDAKILKNSNKDLHITWRMTWARH